MFIGLIMRSQQRDNDAKLELLKRFDPLLRKYSYFLNYDDGYYDLQADFIELLHDIRLDKLHSDMKQH